MNKLLQFESTPKGQGEDFPTTAVFSQLLKVEVSLNGVGVARPKGSCLLGGV